MMSSTATATLTLSMDYHRTLQHLHNAAQASTVVHDCYSHEMYLPVWRLRGQSTPTSTTGTQKKSIDYKAHTAKLMLVYPWAYNHHKHLKYTSTLSTNISRHQYNKAENVEHLVTVPAAETNVYTDTMRSKSMKTKHANHHTRCDA